MRESAQPDMNRFALIRRQGPGGTTLVYIWAGGSDLQSGCVKTDRTSEMPLASGRLPLQLLAPRIRTGCILNLGDRNMYPSFMGRRWIAG